MELSYLYAPKTLSSGLFFMTCIITAVFILYDLMSKHLMPQRWRRAMFFLSLAFLACANYGLARAYDSISDLIFLASHPEAVTTASQEQAYLLEGPLFVASFFVIAFLLSLNFAYYTQSKPQK